MTAPTQPPEMAFFEADRVAAGDDTVTLRLGPLALELRGLDDEQADGLARRFGPYLARGTADDALALRVRLGLEPVDYFIEPPARPERVPVRLACDGGRVRYLSYRVAGWFDTLGGEGLLLLARGEYEPFERVVENYVRAAVAWQAASRGGALVHAASAVLGERGYLFYGESGAGKSTLSAANRRARIVSDDLSLVLPDDGSPSLIGSPFRGTYTGGEPVLGRFPIAAGFRLLQARADERAEVRDVPRVRATAELVGNLPFVAELFDRRPDLFVAVQRAFADVPLRHLVFRKDDESYWDAIAAAGF